ncbi:MFS transporter [Sphingomonas sp. S2-65]|uniref:MFS transporter n=1 Tax=Sphingomonas sp. S2-65 TaxID=2903960 RepID=UPI001F34E50F|nr:MFS transporter [Sphingomonas sp. S2-65]UYY58096.1 MFS transporter [Sphingomonas sp. S2-65]
MRVFWAIAVGNCLELYDFTLFGYFSVVLAKVFFPQANPMTALLLTLSTFGVGFVTRPVGGILFGAYADRNGRRKAIVMTMGLMSLGTAIVAVCPGYATLGVAAPIILVIGRLIQGLGMGGEVGPTAALLFELSRGRRRVLYVSIFMASQGVSALLGGLTGYALSATFSPMDISAGLWRLPFLIGLLIGPVGLYLRTTLQDPDDQVTEQEFPVRRVLARHKAQLASGFLLFLSGTASTYVVMFYLPTYLTGVVNAPPRTAFLAGCVAGLVMAAGSLLGGLVADRFQIRRLLVLIAITGSSLLIIPAFRLLHDAPGLAATLTIVAVLVSFNSLQAGSVLSLILESFPAGVRATGLALVYSTGVIVGGFGQLIVTALIQASGDPAAPGFYMIACSGLTALSLIFGRFSEAPRHVKTGVGGQRARVAATAAPDRTGSLLHVRQR